MSVSSVKEPRKNKTKNESKVKGERNCAIFSVSGKIIEDFSSFDFMPQCFDFSLSRSITISVD